MNVGPRPDGTITEEAAERLRIFGDWLETNDEAIRGSRPWWEFGEGPTEVTSSEFEEASSVTFTDEDVRFTRSADGTVVYAVFLNWPEDAEVALETSLHRRLTGRGDGRADDLVDPKSVELLGTDVDLEWGIEAGADTLSISLPADPPAELDHAYVLRLG
jgi:alpha-L-fucosidase